MGCLNNVTGYYGDLLANRTVVRHGSFALLALDDLVKNIIPGFENCDATILSAPKLGASFVDYLVMLHQNDDDQQGFSGEDIETSPYVISGNITARAERKTFTLSEGGYLYCPSGSLMTFVNAQAEGSQIFLYKRRYIPVEGHAPRLVSDNANELERIHYEDMGDVILLDFLPEELGFNMNMHILSFTPNANHGYIETHVQEHSTYTFSGQGVCSLDNNWIPVKKGDRIFMGVYSLQADYGVRHGEASSYTYSEDCSRDVEIQVILLA